MREILFRGKIINGAEWLKGYFCYSSISDLPCIQDKATHEYKNVIPETVGQYTGLTDKNSKKIFEGDIVRYADIDEYQYYLECKESPEDYDEKLFKNMWTVDYVVYGDKVGYPAFDFNSHNFECNGLSELCESYQYFYEVIGNIHDNPELLKEAENE